MSLQPGHLIGHYTVVGHLGTGGMGEVYRARDSKLDRDVAIKVLPESFAQEAERLARFIREAKTLASISHPNIAHIHGFEDSNGIRALVMELVDGEDLSERIAQGAIGPSECVAIAKQVAEALEAAHEQGIVHRDLKPANIKVRADGTVKVLDFGLAKAVDPSLSNADMASAPTITSHKTRIGTVLGTVAYMSPEQAKGRAVDKRTDIWAFGVVCYEMLTGRRAFAGDDVSETMASVLRDRPDFSLFPADTPPRLRRLIERCLERDLRMRLRDIGEARVELIRIASGDSGTESAPSAPAEKTAAQPKVGGPLAIAAALLVGAVATGVVMHYTASASGPVGAKSVRAVLNAPPGADFVETDRPIAVSPDGADVAVVARSRSAGKPALFVRSLSTLEWRALAGTEDAIYPFWSPNGKSIGFFANGQLKRIDLADGLVRVLCDAPAGRGGDWNAQGMIVFAPAAVGGLSIVPEGGGAASVYSTPSNGTETQRFPHFLPDGKKVLHYSNGRDPRGVYVFDPNKKTSQFVMDAQTEAKFLTPGLLAFVRDEILLVQSFDLATLKTSGEAHPAANGVGFDAVRHYASLDISSSGTLVYLAAQRPPGHKLSWMDRAGSETAVAMEPLTVSTADLSRDGSRAAVGTIGAHGELGVSVLDLARGIVTPLAGDQSRLLARFVDNDTHVAFEELNLSGTAIAITDLSGGNSRFVTTDPGYEYHVAGELADGKSLLYSRLTNVGKVGQLVTTDLAPGTTPRPLLNSGASEVSPRLSPQARWVAYISGDAEIAKAGTRPQLAVAPLPGGGTHTQVTPAGLQADAWGWLSDEELYWQDLTNKVWSATIAMKGSQVSVSQPRPMFGGKAVELGTRLIAYSPARERFFVARPAGAAVPTVPVLVSDWRPSLAGAGK